MFTFSWTSNPVAIILPIDSHFLDSCLFVMEYSAFCVYFVYGTCHLYLWQHPLHECSLDTVNMAVWSSLDSSALFHGLFLFSTWWCFLIFPCSFFSIPGWCMIKILDAQAFCIAGRIWNQWKNRLSMLVTYSNVCPELVAIHIGNGIFLIYSYVKIRAMKIYAGQ